MMMQAYPEAYTSTPEEPTRTQIQAVLGKSRANVERFPEDSFELFGSYQQHFKLSSKPVAHISALALLDDEGLLSGLPPVLQRLVGKVGDMLKGIPE
jgi:putative ATP-dependent endonuclease of the OLD family